MPKPLDFMAVTDHCANPSKATVCPWRMIQNSKIVKLLVAQSEGQPSSMKIYLWLGTWIIQKNRVKENSVDPAVKGTVWKEVVAMADKYYQPGKFTTFAAYGGVRRRTIATCTATSSSKTLRKCRNSPLFPGLRSSRESLELDGYPAQGG